MEGIFSRDPIANPLFYNWNILHLNYCDGACNLLLSIIICIVYEGYASDPIEVNGLKIYFRGERIAKGTANEMLDIMKNCK